MIGLKHIRIDRQITQQQLAFLTGIPQPVISLIESGKWRPSDVELGVLGRALGVSSSVLLKDVTVQDGGALAAS